MTKLKTEITQRNTSTNNFLSSLHLDHGADENAFFEKIRQNLDLKDFVRVDEVQDAFAKLTESFQKKIKD